MQGSTTPARRSAHLAPKTWCPATKEQGIAGSGAPRRPGGRPIRPQRRGARRRRNKGLRGVKHHARPPKARPIGDSPSRRRQPNPAGDPKAGNSPSRRWQPRPVPKATLKPRRAHPRRRPPKPVNQKTGAARRQSLFLSCARHGTSLAGESPVTGIYRQV